MSEKVKLSPEESLARVYTDMRKTIMFFSIGWIIFMFGATIAGEPGNMFLMLLGAAIAAGPIVAILFLGGSFAGLFKADYEVITTYSDGSKKSDGGAESRSNNMTVAFILALIAIFIGIVVQFIRLIIQISKHFYYTRKVAQKPDFLHSGTFLIVIGFAVLIGAPAIFSPIGSAKEKARVAAIVKESNAALVELAKAAPILGTKDEKFMARVNEPISAIGSYDADTELKQGDEIYVYSITAHKPAYSGESYTAEITFYKPPQQRVLSISDIDDLKKLTYVRTAPKADSSEYNKLFGK